MRDTLTDKQYKMYRTLSRYETFPFYYSTQDKKYVYGTTEYLDNTTEYYTYTTRMGDTYDSISYIFYGNPTYYWIICSYNRIDDPFDKPKIGTKIKVPTISTIKFEDK